MPSTRVVVESQGGAPRHRASNSKGFIASTYQTFTSEENASVVRSVAFFGVAIAFLASSWSELLVQ